MEHRRRIPFYKALREAIEPILKAEGFELTELRGTPPESLCFERQAEVQRPFARIIYDGGPIYLINQIYIQANVGDIYLMNGELLSPNYKPATVYRGWGYDDDEGLKTIVAELLGYTQTYLLAWIANPRPIQPTPPVLNDDEKRQARQMLVDSIPVGKSTVAYLRGKGKHEEAEKLEAELTDRQKLIQQYSHELGDQ
jgi:hypothetical protein